MNLVHRNKKRNEVIRLKSDLNARMRQTIESQKKVDWKELEQLLARTNKEKTNKNGGEKCIKQSKLRSKRRYIQRQIIVMRLRNLR